MAKSSEPVQQAARVRQDLRDRRRFVERLLLSVTAAAICLADHSSSGADQHAAPPEGFVALFDGKTLEGWSGDRAIWSVNDGTIIGQTTTETKLKVNNFLIWKDQVEDFELQLKFRIEGGNSGIYYRARKQSDDPKIDPLIGTQADFDASGRWTGVIMEWRLRDVLAERGQKVMIDEQGKKRVSGSTGDPEKLLSLVKPTEWNSYRVLARGGHVVLEINGQTMCELDDRDPRRIRKGCLALQVHVGPPMKVQFKDIYYREL